MSKAAQFIAVIDAADSHDIAACPNTNVKINVLPYGRVRLTGTYEDLMQVLNQFVGISSSEADELMFELV